LSYSSLFNDTYTLFHVIATHTRYLSLNAIFSVDNQAWSEAFSNLQLYQYSEAVQRGWHQHFITVSLSKDGVNVIAIQKSKKRFLPNQTTVNLWFDNKILNVHATWVGLLLIFKLNLFLLNNETSMGNRL
jgi:hypothetical protein